VPTTLRPRAGFLLSQAGQRLFVAAVFGIGAMLVYPPRNGGWIFFGPFVLLAVLATIYGLAVAIMARRMRLTVTDGEISCLEYFKPRSVPVDQAGAFQLVQRRGRYGPGILDLVALALGTKSRGSYLLKAVRSATTCNPPTARTSFAPTRRPARY